MSLKQKRFLWMVLCFSAYLVLTGCSRCDSGKPADKTPPTVPNGISITAVSPTEVKVSWKTSADNRAVKEYRIYRNGTYLKSTDEKTMTDTGLTPKTKYCYKISACDAAGNESAQSTDVCAIL
jgi:fibronectin type 3 domain-containing protein